MSDAVSQDEARAAKVEVLDRLRDLPILAGIGITENARGYCVKVNLKEPSTSIHIPEQIGRVPVIVEVVGKVMKRAVP